MDNPDNNTLTTDISSCVEMFIDCCNGNPTSFAALSAKAVDKSYTAFQRIPFMKLLKYLKGVKKAEDDLGSACQLSDKLFSDSKKATDNAIRLIKYVADIDEEKKFDYINNTTRALLLDYINPEIMFRIFKVIDGTMADDLKYMASIIEQNDVFKCNIQIQALAQNGLMIPAGIDADAGIEDQEYAVTKLGYLVDQYAISFGNDARQHWYKSNRPQSIKPSMPGEPTFEAISTGDNNNTLVISNRHKK